MTGFLGGNDWVFGAEVSGAGMTGFLGKMTGFLGENDWVFGAEVSGAEMTEHGKNNGKVIF